MTGSAPDLPERVRDTIARYVLLSPTDRVLIALSGGPDSVCLLYLLRALGYDFAVGHFNHQTRGEASDHDAQFAGNLAALHDAPFALGGGDVRATAARTGESFEACARRMRYGFLVEAAREHACTVIATGHTATDQAETILMRVLRGGSPEGLAGIPARGEREGLPIVRPLIDTPRDAIATYLRAHDFPHRKDASNDDLAHFRNRVRGELLPILESYNPNVRDALRRLGAIQTVENDYIEPAVVALTKEALGEEAIDRTHFRAAHPAIQRRALSRWAQAKGARPGHTLLDGASEFICHGATGQRFDLGHGLLLCNGVAITVLEHVSARAVEISETPLRVPGDAVLLGQRVTARRLDRRTVGDGVRELGAGRVWFDGCAVSDDLRLRPWREGDRFTPFGMGGSKKVADYLSERHVPAPLRGRVLLLVDGDAIIWVVGHGRSDRGPIGPNTEAIIEVQVTHEIE